jgi:hypothetical protein
MKLHKTRVSAAFLIWLTVGQLASGQELTKLKEAMQQFKQKHLEVTDLTLEKDASAVVAAAPTVKRRLEGSGFSDSAIEEALIASWRSLRTHRAQTEGIDKSDVVNEAVQQGLLFVDSVPDGAAVMINGEQYPATRTSQWLLAGRYHIILQKDGYVPIDGDEEVYAGKTVTFTRSLIPGRR